jgi:CRP-like cAMP-binding protein
MAGQPRWCDAVAATPLTGLRLSAERLFDALEDDFSMAEDLLAALALQLRQLRYG